MSSKKALSELPFCETGFEGMQPTGSGRPFFWDTQFVEGYVCQPFAFFLTVLQPPHIVFFLDTSWQYGSEGEKEAELLGLFRFRSCLLNYLLMECVDQEVCNYYIFILYICRTLVEAISDYIVLHVLYI